MSHDAPIILDRTQNRLIRRGLVLQWLTIFHAILESGVALAAGISAGSVVLLGFGLDSFIEVMSASIVIWRLFVQSDSVKRNKADRTGLRFVGICFVALAIYVSYDSGLALVKHEIPQDSMAGVILAVFSVFAMPVLARAKRSLAKEIDSAAMNADSIQSDLCAYLSGILLIGLTLNWLFGWWWADPITALIMVPIILKEGVQALKGKACGCVACADVSGHLA